jgi:hypothetical protein
MSKIQGIEYRYADVIDMQSLQQLVVNNQINWVVHFRLINFDSFKSRLNSYIGSLFKALY